jgi:ABC-type multidrug transport system fused ATPase/permease subunit
VAPVPHLGSLATLIPQDPQVFAGTIGYNITLGLPYSEAEVARATALTQVDPLLKFLPKGLESEVKERGANLSVGQRQRIALARGMLAAQHSSLIFLDEPTSSLDPATETAIYEAFLGAFGDACIVSTLHRLNLLPYFDEIVFMAEGRIVDAGPRLEVLARHADLRRAAGVQLDMVPAEIAA